VAKIEKERGRRKEMRRERTEKEEKKTKKRRIEVKKIAEE